MSVYSFEESLIMKVKSVYIRHDKDGKWRLEDACGKIGNRVIGSECDSKEDALNLCKKFKFFIEVAD
jgi:hypothetical protein